MNDTIPRPDDSVGGSVADKDEVRRTGGGLLTVIVVLVLVIGAAAAWFWWQERNRPDLGDQLATRLSPLQASTNQLLADTADLEARLAALESAPRDEGLAPIREDLSRLDAEVNESGESIGSLSGQLDSAQLAIEAMNARLVATEAAVSGLAETTRASDRSLDLAEVDYLLRLANERVVLFSDPEGADRALALAEGQLARLDDPIYLGVRREISAARTALARVNSPDTVGLAVRLDDLQAQVSSFPFPGDDIEHSITIAEDAGWWERLKNSLSGLVSVRHRSEETTLTLEDQDLVRQGLWLQLESARIALMRGDAAAWESSLGRASDRLQTFFDTADAGVAAAGEELGNLAGQQISPELPDLSGPASALRSVNREFARPPAPIETPTETPAETTDVIEDAIGEEQPLEEDTES